jgi:hypothetical protein
MEGGLIMIIREEEREGRKGGRGWGARNLR